MSLRPIAEIASYHAHIYFDGPEQRAIAMDLRDRIAERFTVALGRVHDRRIGPHARAMYQVSFDVPTFALFVPWLMLNRQGLAVLVHPNTGRERIDHLEQGLWLGEILPIVNQDMLQEETEAEEARPPNTAPTLVP
ncbi:DOPA 4,5-dioxygenase family protein [Dongia rigui]|uniref:DOPA 4,5-dioxygenase family protein n=1 Tax=Dongia rigui TaxID=940149 RepID=A0ABU5DWI4_9PROT|nr:DOPA 4,5-dioxygenase family protein [Dongia rigui]MDY0871679.1 DOPA 4,5-dioxygenase family protein [Dongia rigui]